VLRHTRSRLDLSLTNCGDFGALEERYASDDPCFGKDERLSRTSAVIGQRLGLCSVVM